MGVGLKPEIKIDCQCGTVILDTITKGRFFSINIFLVLVNDKDSLSKIIRLPEIIEDASIRLSKPRINIG